jgi:hypothetical protein
MLTHDENAQTAKRNEYAAFMNWTDRGILKDLKELFEIDDPPLPLLLTIARVLSEIIKIPLDRQDKRRREFLVGWFNKHYDHIRPHVSGLVLYHENGELKGKEAQRVTILQDADPERSLIKYLTNTTVQ